jgi:NADPH-dependent glutamate synthase beta subunit-like oxidoreductase
VNDKTSSNDSASKLGDKHPVWVDRLPPCNLTCPAGENIQEWLQLTQALRYEDAWRALTANNPFPAIHGRVCYHPCENGCNRKRLDKPVSIHAVERFLGDLAIGERWKFHPAAPTGKRVLVIGSGPCGLSAAYHLARLGHSVTVHEAAAKIGGMMRYAIPEYRLPRWVLDAEINRIAEMGVVFKTHQKTEHLGGLFNEGLFDAICLAIGAQLSKRVDLPAADAGRILDALKFLAAAEDRPSYCVGRRVAVYGGGNTAMDAARTALRLGATESMIIYRRDQAHMPAHKSELDEAVFEGINVNWLRTVKEVGEGEIQVEIMQLDAKGKPQPTGKTETIRADMLILALGQETQSEFLKNVPGIVINAAGEVEVNDNMMTGHRGIFAGGDMIPANKTVTTAVGHGKKAARHVDAYLHGKTLVAAPKHPAAKFDRLNLETCPKLPQAEQPALDVAERQGSFEETLGGLSETAAHDEAKRCLSCGNCFNCDTCHECCPQAAILKVGDDEYRVHVPDCNGCGLCANECPCGAIDMVSENPAAAKDSVVKQFAL